MTNLEQQARHLYAVLDSQDCRELATLVSADIVAQLGSSSPIGFAEWQESSKGFYVGFPKGRHVIDD